MRSHTISLLMATVLLPLSGCGSLMKVEEPVAVQPVQVKKAAPVRKAAVAAPVQPRVVQVQPKVVKKPITPAASERSDRGEGGGGW